VSGGSAGIAIGETLPISLQIDDGNTGLFPQASLHDDTGASLGSVDLSHVADGMYSGAAFAMPDAPWVSSTYIVYTDAAHTTESTAYSRSLDVFARDDSALMSLYGRKVWLNVGAGSPGSVLGTNGTEANPVDNMADALLLAAALGVKTLHVCGSVTLAAPLAGFAVDGVCTQNFGTTIDINGQDVSGTTFTACRIQGAVAYSPGEYPTFVDCYLGFFGSAVTGLAGTLYRCGIGFVVEFIDGGPCLLVDCYTALGDVTGAGNPSRLVYPAAGAFFSNVVLIGYRGDVTVENMDNATDSLTGTITGTVTLDASCSAGTVHVSGIGEVVDGSAGTTVVDDQLVSNVDDLDAAIALFGALSGAPVTHTPTTITAGGFSWTVAVVGPNVTITRVT